MRTLVAQRARAGVIWTVAVVLASIASPALALHRETIPGAVAFGGPGSENSWGRSWARYYAFSSTRDLTNTGSTGRQIFVYNHFNWVCQRGRPEPSGAGPLCIIPDATGIAPVNQPFLIQVTNGPGSPDNPSVTEVFATNAVPQPPLPPQPALAQWVAFDADGSYNGGTGCEASRRQVFLYEVFSHELRQITFACDGDSTNPTLAFHAGLLAFESTGTITGPNSPPGIKQIYSYFRGDNVLRKVTQGLADSSFPMINKVGTRISFQSAANHLGNHADPLVPLFGDTGVQQIFWSDYDRSRHIHTLHQLTNGNGDSEHPYNAEDRPIIAFESSATDLPGAFAPAGTQIYMARTDTEPVPDLPPVTQITFQNELGNCTWPSIDPSNQRVSFICTQDPSPTGSPGNRVFAFDLEEGRLFQVATATDVTGPIAMSQGLWFVVMTTSHDLNGSGGCGRQLWLVDYFAGPTDGFSPIGIRRFTTQAGDAVNGSEGQLVTRSGTLIGDVTHPGYLDMRFESIDPGVPDPNTRGEVIVTIPLIESEEGGLPVPYAKLPPIPFPGVGAICIEQRAEGFGTLDCDGDAGEVGPDGAHVSVRQDHFTDGEDPNCIRPGACREDDPACHGSLLPGPHLFDCPRCIFVPGTGERCNSGSRVGLVCPVDNPQTPDHDGDAFCRTDYDHCPATYSPGDPAEKIAMCNGPMLTEFTGFYGGGGSVIHLPVSLSLSLDPGADGLYCKQQNGVDDDPKDPYFAARTVNPLLRLTTATSTGRIIDPNAIESGPSLGTDMVGGPIDCTRLRAADLTGAELVGSIPLLDMNLPGTGITDAVFSLRLEAKPDPIDVCAVACTADVDCNDLDACNGLETCAGGFCTAGTPVVCDDLNACNGRETCSPTTGACLSGQPPLCEDGNPCNGVETCDPVLGCVAGTPVECADPNPCNGTETCNPLTGTCLPGVPKCDDLNPCNGSELCDPVSGACSQGIPIDCDDDILCNGLETCDPEDGSCDPGTPPCDDGLRCNGTETCDPQTGACSAPHPNTIPQCDSTDPCFRSECVEGVAENPCAVRPVCDDGIACNGEPTCAVEVIPPGGTCTITCSGTIDDGCIANCGPLVQARCTLPAVTNQCDDGDPCNGQEICSQISGQCRAGVPLCDDGNACNGVETCAGGTCGDTPDLDCDDLNPCTIDSCDPIEGCVHQNRTGSCDDLNLCTLNDQCLIGSSGVATCTGTAVLCSDNDACNGIETCDVLTGACVPGVPPVCDDNNICTNDTCDAALGCLQINNTNACDDASPCTDQDVCQGGICQGQNICADGDVCNGDETCDPTTLACGAAPAPLDCDDLNVCTDDSCDPVGGCRYLNNSGVCDDGDPLTTGDMCVNGACTGLGAGGGFPCVPATCDDAVACTVDTCDPLVGCVHEPSTTGVEGLLCLLQALESAINNAPALAFRSNKVRTKLLNLVQGGIRKVEKVIDGARRPRPLLSKTRKALNLFERRVRNAQGKLFIEQNFGDQLLALVDSARSLVQPLVKPSAKLAAVQAAENLARAQAEELAGSLTTGPQCTED